MYITPITGMSPIGDIMSQLQTKQATSTDNTFQNILTDLINNVNQTDQTVKNDILNIAQGTADDLHTITINAEKAELATLMLVQVRNKVLDAYNEIMRVTL